jgi:hypothetical protein
MTTTIPSTECDDDMTDRRLATLLDAYLEFHNYFMRRDDSLDAILTIDELTTELAPIDFRPLDDHAHAFKMTAEIDSYPIDIIAFFNDDATLECAMISADISEYRPMRILESD